MKIDLDAIKGISRDKKYRTIAGVNNKEIKGNMYPFSKEYLLYLESLSTFEIASIILDKVNWIKSRNHIKSQKSTFVYSVGDIVMVYLGSNNYGYEPSYFHPAIVYANFFDSILIIPCSSTIPTHDRFVLGNNSDGFKNETAILIDKIRVIDKKRIQRNSVGGVVGKLSKIKIDEIRNKLLNIYFSGTEKYIFTMKSEIENLKNEVENLKNEVENLKNEIKKLTPIEGKNIKN